MPKRSRILAVVVGAVLAAGCDSPSAPGNTLPGVSVRYTGAVSGKFSVTAGTSTSQVYSEDFWADSSGFVSYSYVDTGDGAVNAIAMSGPVLPGDYTIHPFDCNARCYDVTVALGHARDDSWRDGETSWVLETGAIHVQQPGADGHVRGTFTGTGHVHQVSRGTKDVILGEVTVSGTFDTTLVPPHRPS